jgi:hypothetical protein
MPEGIEDLYQWMHRPRRDVLTWYKRRTPRQRAWMKWSDRGWLSRKKLRWVSFDGFELRAKLIRGRTNRNARHSGVAAGASRVVSRGIASFKPLMPVPMSTSRHHSSGYLDVLFLCSTRAAAYSSFLSEISTNRRTQLPNLSVRRSGSCSVIYHQRAP